MNKSKLFFIVLLTFTASLRADPLSLKGLNFSMTKNALLETIHSDDYSCDAPVRILDVTNISCTKGESNITFYEKKNQITRISFNCNNFNVCDYKINEVGQALVDKGVIDSLEADYSQLDGMYYTGRGPSGDILEVTSSPWGNVFVDLRRGSFG